MASPAQSTPSYPSTTSSPDALTASRLRRHAPSPTYVDAMARVRHYLEHDIGEAPPAPAPAPPPPPLPPSGPRLRLRMDTPADFDAVYNRSASGPQVLLLDVPLLQRDPDWLPRRAPVRERIEVLYDGDEPWESSSSEDVDRSVVHTPQVSEGEGDSQSESESESEEDITPESDEVKTDSEMENMMGRIGTSNDEAAPETVTTAGRDKGVYSVESLIGLQKRLPALKCDLKSFSADAWRAQILVPPGQKHDSSQTWFPADFPPSTARKMSAIPTHELPSSVVHDCLSESTEDEVVFKGAGNTIKKKQRDNSSSLSTFSGAASAALPLPHRQPYPPPKGIIPQQDAGFARFLKEATSSSPNNKRVTAGGRIVSAENPPRLYGRRKQGTDNSWARVPYSHIQTEMPQGTNDTFLSFPNGSFYWGPQGELYVRPAPEVLYQALYPGMHAPQVSLPVTDLSGAYQMPGDGGVQIPGQGVQMGLNVGSQVPMMGQGLPVMQMPMQSGAVPGVDPMMTMSGAPAYGSQFQWTHNGDGTGQMEVTSNPTRNIRTPRVHFPIGSRFDYEQNQQTLRNRLAQLLCEMDNLHYLSAEEAELKKLEKKIVEDQIEQFRQVWELQTYLAGDVQDEQAQRQEMPVTEAHEGEPIGGSRMSSMTKRGSRKSHDREASVAANAKMVPNEGVPMVISSRGSEFQPAPQDMSNVISGAQSMSTPRKTTKDFVVQTPASVAPVHGKENIGNVRPIKSNTLSAFPPGLDQIPARHTVVGVSLRAKSIRKDMTPSIESLHINVDLETSPTGAAGPSEKAGVLEDRNLNKDSVQDESSVPLQPVTILPKVSVDSLRKSAGMPIDDIEGSKVPADKHAFADQFRIIKSASKIFYRYASVEHVEEAEADKDDPTHPYYAVSRGESSSAQGNVKTATRDGDGAWDVTGMAPKSDYLFTSATNKSNENDSNLSNKERSLRPTSAIESLRKIYQQHSQRFQSSSNKNESRLRSNQAPAPIMENFKTETSSKGKKVELAQEREAAEQNVKIQEILGVINDPIHQKDFLEQMLKTRRHDGVGYQPEKFEKLVHEELGKHNVRKNETGQSDKMAAKKGIPGNTALGMSKLNVKAPLSPPLPTATTARGLLGAYHPAAHMASGASAAPGNMLDIQSAASQSTFTGGLSSPFVHTSSRTSANDPHGDEVVSHFRQLKRDERAEIARYRAEHPDER